jgi:hypothetical protein
MFIYPDMVAHNVIYIIYLNDINPVIQAILVAAIVLILAYVLLSLNSYFLAFLTGELWCESLIGRTLIWFKRIEASSTSTSPARRLFIECKQLLEKTKSHPSSLDVQTDEPKPPGPPSPTPLGDVMNCTANYVRTLYKIEMSALWPHMEIVLANAANTNNAGSSDSSTADNAGAALKARIDNEKVTLDFLVTLTVIFVLFALEEVFVLFCWLYKTPDVLWGPIIFLFLAYVVYKAAVAKARTWGGAVQMAFDMYRFELRKRLDIRPFNSPENERKVWNKVSAMLKSGTPTPEHDDLFVGIPPYPAHPSPITVNSSTNVKVTPFSTTVKGNGGITSITHVLVVDNVETNKNIAQGIYVLISDTRVLNITTPGETEQYPWHIQNACLGEGQDKIQPQILHTNDTTPSR